MVGSCVKLTKTDWLWPTTQAEDMQYWSPLHFVYDPPSQLELPTRLEWVDSFELHLSDFPHETKPTIKTTDEAAATRPEVATGSGLSRARQAAGGCDTAAACATGAEGLLVARQLGCEHRPFPSV